MIKQSPDYFIVPYDWLTIETNATEVNREAIHFLFDERETGVNSGSGTCKWLGTKPATAATIEIIITVKDDYPDLALFSYGLKTANDAPERDPL